MQTRSPRLHLAARVGRRSRTRSRSPSLLITGGKLATCYGRRRLFVIGLVIFTLSSLACGLAPNAGFLIGARAVQGVGAALMSPATLSIITATFPPKQRGPGDRDLGRRLRARARDRPARRRPDHRAHQLELDLLHQRPGRHARDRRRRSSSSGSRATPRTSRASTCRASSPRAARPVRAQLRADRGQPTRLDVAGDPRAASPLRPSLLVAFVLLEHRQRLPMLDLSLFRIGSFTRRQHRRDARLARDVRRLLLRLALRPEHPRLLADAGRRDVPADDGPDHPHRADRRPPLRPHRVRAG